MTVLKRIALMPDERIASPWEDFRVSRDPSHHGAA